MALWYYQVCHNKRREINTAEDDNGSRMTTPPSKLSSEKMSGRGKNWKSLTACIHTIQVQIWRLIFVSSCNISFSLVSFISYKYHLPVRLEITSSAQCLCINSLSPLLTGCTSRISWTTTVSNLWELWSSFTLEFAPECRDLFFFSFFFSLEANTTRSACQSWRWDWQILTEVFEAASGDSTRWEGKQSVQLFIHKSFLIF